MTTAIAIAYHSGYGHTKKQAEAVAEGARNAGAAVSLIAVQDISAEDWATLDAADAIVFGAPTYMGNVSGQFKVFADATSKPWFQQKWKDKIAAGFTNSASINGDKYASIQYLWTLAMQHGMVWVGTGLLPSNSKSATRNDINWLAGSGGALAQSPSDASPEEGPLPGDLETARLFGARIAAVTAQFVKGGR
ncbi:flavodoxin family protein [Fluviicoccus keumensis]|nr:flavodoxin family protein [Fluviicoccus keumensis]